MAGHRGSLRCLASKRKAVGTQQGGLALWRWLNHSSVPD